MKPCQVHQMKLCQVDWQKLVFQEKIVLFQRKLSSLFIVKYKSSYSCESAFYFNLTIDIIESNCNFDLYFNKTDITQTVLDGGDEIVLANWPNDKHIIYNVNNDIPVKIPSHPYVLVNRSILCNCSIEADNHFLLESIAACDNKDSNLVMYSPLTWLLLIT